MIKYQEISLLRLLNQQVLEPSFTDIQQLVDWMGAMQAQDYNMAKWAAGIRLPGSTDKTIGQAIDKGDILRTHVLRPTWHLVLKENINWMLKLTAPQIKSSLRSRHRELELDDQVIKKTNKIFRDVLKGTNHLTREELQRIIEKSKIPVDSARMNHFLLVGELDGIICNGVRKGKNHSYALLEERVPKARNLSTDEALTELAKRYFTSHGPATLQDFVWWSGLLVTQARQGLESIKSKLISETINDQTYWFPESDRAFKNHESIFLLPAYDEFLISYRDRKPSLPFEHHTKTISDNGIFRPVMVENGQVTGLWRKIVKPGKLIIEMSFLSKETKMKAKKNDELLRKETARLADFLNLKAELKII